MKTYTPGPWTFSRTATPQQKHGVWDSLGRLIATTAGCHCLDQRPGSPETEEADLGNARLIAAAPNLLAALKDVTEELERLARNAEANGYKPDGVPLKLARAQAKIAREHIAEAEGTSNG